MGREEESLGEETAAQSPSSHSFLPHIADSFKNPYSRQCNELGIEY
jgi:hypothetical protein